MPVPEHGLGRAINDRLRRAAMEEAKKLLTDLEWLEDPYDAATGADCLVIVTEWNQFRNLDLDRIRGLMGQPAIVDLRNIYQPDDMRLTGQPGNFGPYPQWDEGLKLLRRAADLGVNFFDSAWAYGPEHADRIVGEALEGRQVAVATKGGVDKPEPGRITVDGSRETLLHQIDQALINLRRPHIDLFQLHRVDPAVPIEDSVAALAEAQTDGRIGHIGLSNVTLEQLERALSVAPIASIQNRYNMEAHPYTSFHIHLSPLRPSPTAIERIARWYFTRATFLRIFQVI